MQMTSNHNEMQQPSCTVSSSFSFVDVCCTACLPLKFIIKSASSLKSVRVLANLRCADAFSLLSTPYPDNLYMTISKMRWYIYIYIPYCNILQRRFWSSFDIETSYRQDNKRSTWHGCQGGKRYQSIAPLGNTMQKHPMPNKLWWMSTNFKAL